MQQRATRCDDLMIAQRLQARDPEVIGELMVRHEARLRGYLMRLTGDRELSEDLLQEIWMRVVIRGGQFKGDSQIGTWLFAIARNMVFDLRRKNMRSVSVDVTREEGEAPELQLQAQGKTPFELCADTQHVRLLAKAMRTLTPRHRKFVELRFKREMSLSEIARETGTSLSTVKSTLYRSLRTLRLKTSFPVARRA